MDPNQRYRGNDSYHSYFRENAHMGYQVSQPNMECSPEDYYYQSHTMNYQTYQSPYPRHSSEIHPGFDISPYNYGYETISASPYPYQNSQIVHIPSYQDDSPAFVERRQDNIPSQEGYYGEYDRSQYSSYSSPYRSQFIPRHDPGMNPYYHDNGQQGFPSPSHGFPQHHASMTINDSSHNYRPVNSFSTPRVRFQQNRFPPRIDPPIGFEGNRAPITTPRKTSQTHHNIKALDKSILEKASNSTLNPEAPPFYPASHSHHGMDAFKANIDEILSRFKEDYDIEQPQTDLFDQSTATFQPESAGSSPEGRQIVLSPFGVSMHSAHVTAASLSKVTEVVKTAESYETMYEKSAFGLEELVKIFKADILGSSKFEKYIIEGLKRPEASKEDYPVPSEYLVYQSIRDKISKFDCRLFNDDLLLYIYYLTDDDRFKLSAIAQLYSRKWRFLIPTKTWLKLPLNYSPGDTYTYFDPVKWENVTTDKAIDIKQLETTTYQKHLNYQTTIVIAQNYILDQDDDSQESPLSSITKQTL